MVTVVMKEMTNWCEWDQMTVIELIYNSTAADASDSSPFHSVQCQLETFSSVQSQHSVMSSDHLLAGLPMQEIDHLQPFPTSLSSLSSFVLPVRAASSPPLCNVVILPFLWLVFPTHSRYSSVTTHLKHQKYFGVSYLYSPWLSIIDQRGKDTWH